jgi:hypothetical protein
VEGEIFQHAGTTEAKAPTDTFFDIQGGRDLKYGYD